MKRNPTFLIAALGAALLSLPALRAEDAPVGRPPGGPPGGQREMDREKMGEKMADELGLTADQRTKLKGFNQAQKAELEALRANTVLSPEAKRAQLETIRKSYMEKRQALMTPEQREKAKLMREKGEKQRREQGGERPEKPAAPK